MMKYHPDIELLLQYSSGTLAPALSIAIGLHQQQCELCQQRIGELNAVGGATLDTLPADFAENNKLVSIEQVTHDFDLLMADIEKLPDDDTSITPDLAIASYDSNLFEQLQNGKFEQFNWSRVSPNIWQAKIPMQDTKFEIELLKFSANTKIPKHTHLGREFTLVMQGDFYDAQDSYQVGEFIEQDRRTEHQPIAGKQGCICLAITDAPLKFTGTFGAVLNWLNRR